MTAEFTYTLLTYLAGASIIGIAVVIILIIFLRIANRNQPNTAEKEQSDS